MSASPWRLEARGLGLVRRTWTVLSEVSLALPARGSVAVIGPNGAGKSSLLSLLAGLLPAHSGQVLLDGRDIARVPVAERAHSIGFMPQHFEPHWDLTLTELLGMRLTGSRTSTAEQVMEREGLAEFRHRRWSTMSGGEQARALLATVLAPDPPVLLADEPGANLDVRHRLALVETLARRGRTQLVVVAMHDLDLAFRHFERVVVVGRGGIVADGGAELVHEPLLDHIFGVAFERIAASPGVLLRANLHVLSGEQGAA
ncbi:ABC transporter ATP-binding protein [Variovorax sp. HJSM1_2]|uniref:ABC transporter ATP-binding protein n=1 Tax=Variovorax sp. HJSM1_2 TaxID=3366263 RepID=UPI003BC11A3F